MLAIDSLVSFAKSRKFSTHVEDPAFGTFLDLVMIIIEFDNDTFYEEIKIEDWIVFTLHQARFCWGAL